MKRMDSMSYLHSINLFFKTSLTYFDTYQNLERQGGLITLVLLVDMEIVTHVSRSILSSMAWFSQ